MLLLKRSSFRLERHDENESLGAAAMQREQASTKMLQGEWKFSSSEASWQDLGQMFCSCWANDTLAKLKFFSAA